MRRTVSLNYSVKDVVGEKNVLRKIRTWNCILMATSYTCGNYYQPLPERNHWKVGKVPFWMYSVYYNKPYPKIFLDEVIRQNDPEFVKVINEISIGKVSSDTKKYVKHWGTLYMMHNCSRFNESKCITDLHGLNTRYTWAWFSCFSISMLEQNEY